MTMMMKFVRSCLLLLVLQEPSVMLVAGRNQAVSCDKAVAQGILVPAVEGFTNFPCGTYNADSDDPFDGTGEFLGCTYYPKFDEYECTLEGAKAATVIRDLEEAEFANPQPCTADGYELDKIRTWWWLCVKA